MIFGFCKKWSKFVDLFVNCQLSEPKNVNFDGCVCFYMANDNHQIEEPKTFRDEGFEGTPEPCHAKFKEKFNSLCPT